MRRRYFIWFSLVWHAAAAATLNEDFLRQQVSEAAPRILKLALDEDTSGLNTSEFKDRFSAVVFGEANYRVTNEEAFIEFQPIISPQSSFAVGAKKQFQKGISAEISTGITNLNFDINGQQRSPSISTSQLKLAVDLWKNFLGRKDNFERESLFAYWEKNKVLAEIGRHAFWLDLRSIYWNLVMISNQLAITQKMAELAEKQERRAYERYRSSVADMAELSFYRSQNSIRAEQMLKLNFQKQQELRRLQEMLPHLSVDTFEIEPVENERIKSEILACIDVIEKKPDLPLDYTLYDEVIQSSKIMMRQQLSSAALYNNVDINFQSAFFTTAVDPSALGAWEESFFEKRQGFDLMLNVDIPLSLKNTQRQKLSVERKRFDAEQKQTIATIESQHHFVLKSIPMLTAATQQQKVTIKNLLVRNRDIEQKYAQGRISLSDLMADQDRLLEAEFALLSSQNLIVQTLLSYFSYFSKTPCPFNTAAEG